MFRLVARIIYTVLLLIEALVSIRFVLILVNANKNNEIVNLVMKNSEYFIQPFKGIVDDILIFGSLRFELTSIIALVFYMILAFVAVEMIKAFSNS